MLAFPAPLIVAVAPRVLRHCAPQVCTFSQDTVRNLSARLRHLKTLWSSVGGGPERRLLGDLMVLLGAVGSAEYAGASPSFCASNCIRWECSVVYGSVDDFK